MRHRSFRGGAAPPGAVRTAGSTRPQAPAPPPPPCRRYKRGYKNVIDKGVELGRAGQDCQLMMETSGHGALAENDYLDDGAYLAVKVGEGGGGGALGGCRGEGGGGAVCLPWAGAWAWALCKCVTSLGGWRPPAAAPRLPLWPGAGCGGADAAGASTASCSLQTPVLSCCSPLLVVAAGRLGGAARCPCASPPPPAAPCSLAQLPRAPVAAAAPCRW
jgi:hypothetical protein